MKRNLNLILSAVVLASLILVGCAPAATAVPTAAPAPTEAPTMAPAPTVAPAASATSATSSPDTIIIGTTDKIASLDPGDAYSIRDWEVIKNIDYGLIRWKPGTTDLEPGLATDMGTVSKDGLTWTFTLKDGIKFGDGTPLTATLYAQQLNRLLTIGPKCPNDVADSLAVPYVKSITAPDDKTLVFTLVSPIGFFPGLLATSPYVPADPNNFPVDKCVTNPVAPIYGVGPWYIAQYDPDTQMVFKPNPYYTGDLTPQVKQVIVRLYSSPTTMALAVQSGEIDVAWRLLSPDQLTQLKGVSGLTIGTLSGGRIQFLDLNHTMAPFNDPNVCKAVASAIDRNAIADTVYQGQVTPLYSQIPPGFLGADQAFDTMYQAPNLDAAKAFLAKSGYTASNPLKLTLWYPPEHYGASTAQWMQLIKTQLEATGAIQVTLQAQEWSTYVPALTSGKTYPAGVLGWFFDYPDPSDYMDPFVNNRGEGTNVTLPATGSTTGIPINAEAKQLVTLLQQADIETDTAKRTAEYQQAQQIYADMVVTLPIFFSAEHVVYRSNIKGSSNFATPETLNIGPDLEFNYSTLSKSAQ
ncbi:MAG: ABC transporter substrate-binding protein [Anaerolineales bacterium]|jgi:peptide/nickel transport system substrate-binding protein